MNPILYLAERCIRCGFCLEACPTYRLTGRETASPRGRIRLMTSVIGDGAPLTPDIVESIDLCLGCRACETACPSGVRYGAMVEQFRAHIENADARTRQQAGSKAGLVAAMARPALFAKSLALSGQARSIPGLGVMPRPVSNALSGGHGVSLMMPTMPDHAKVGVLPAYSPAIGTRRATVCVLQGCVMRVLYHPVNAATVRVLQRLGCDVICPPDLGCCGALDLHVGRHAQGLEHARDALGVLSSHRFDAFIVNSAGCGSTLREYGELLDVDPVWSSAASQLAEKVRDVSEFVAEIGLPEPLPQMLRRYEARITYHDACHLANGQGITVQPRKLLEAIPGVTLLPLHESDMCCGSAGTYNLTQPEMARRLLDRKVPNIAATGADIVAMGNPGCMAWIEAGLRAQGLPVRVMHVVEVLDAALQAVEP